jgi:hypothetical protein
MLESMEGSSEQQIDRILAALKGKGAAAAPFEDSLALAMAHPEAVCQLGLAVIERYPKGGTFLDAALSYLPQEDWPRLIRHALDSLEEAPDERAAAESVIAYSSLQSPSSLHSELDRIFKLQPNSGSYYEFYPWRESSHQHFDHLRSRVENSDSDAEQIAAWESMLQTRRPSVVSHAISVVDTVYSARSGISRGDWLQVYLHLVGFDYDNGSLNRICPDVLYHLQFPDSFFEDESRPPWLARVHPTWHLPSLGTVLPFGGNSENPCLLCGETLHRLLVLDPVPPRLGVTELRRIELATCLSCLGWEQQPLFYQHDNDGCPANIGYDGSTREPQFPVGPLKEAEAMLAETPRRWFWQDWGLSNSRENLNRIGGEPCWVQDAEFPNCPRCKRLMNYPCNSIPIFLRQMATSGFGVAVESDTDFGVITVRSVAFSGSVLE